MFAYEYRTALITEMEMVITDLLNSDWVGTRPNDTKEVEIKWAYLNAIWKLYMDPNVWGQERIRQGHFDDRDNNRLRGVKSKMRLLSNTLDPQPAES